ncbi:hypothetical protein BC936DRAFT_148206, partial [Jimgerdemannia flammicorona]
MSCTIAKSIMMQNGLTWSFVRCASSFSQTFSSMMLPLLENPDHLLRKPHLEGWYDSNVWSFIVDHALQDLRGMVT